MKDDLVGKINFHNEEKVSYDIEGKLKERVEQVAKKVEKEKDKILTRKILLAIVQSEKDQAFREMSELRLIHKSILKRLEGKENLFKYKEKQLQELQRELYVKE